MAKLITVYWRGIPLQVIAKQGCSSAKVRLSSRFQIAIDRSAVRAGKGSSDAYLSEWRRQTTTCSDDLEAEARTAANQLERQYSDEALLALIRAHGEPIIGMEHTISRN